MIWHIRIMQIMTNELIKKEHKRFLYNVRWWYTNPLICLWVSSRIRCRIKKHKMQIYNNFFICLTILLVLVNTIKMSTIRKMYNSEIFTKRNCGRFGCNPDNYDRYSYYWNIPWICLRIKKIRELFNNNKLVVLIIQKWVIMGVSL